MLLPLRLPVLITSPLLMLPWPLSLALPLLLLHPLHPPLDLLLMSPLHHLPPSSSPNRDRPRQRSRGNKKHRADRAEPADADGFDGGQAHGGAGTGEEVAEEIVAGDDFGGALLHHVEAVGV